MKTPEEKRQYNIEYHRKRYREHPEKQLAYNEKYRIKNYDTYLDNALKTNKYVPKNSPLSAKRRLKLQRICRRNHSINKILAELEPLRGHGLLSNEDHKRKIKLKRRLARLMHKQAQETTDK